MSVHFPDSVWTSVVLPWSTCPTIPTLMAGWTAASEGASDVSFFFLGICRRDFGEFINVVDERLK